MRRPDGSMSKKDRRALLAHGIVPEEDRLAEEAKRKRFQNLLRQIKAVQGGQIIFPLQQTAQSFHALNRSMDVFQNNAWKWIDSP